MRCCFTRDNMHFVCLSAVRTKVGDKDKSMGYGQQYGIWTKVWGMDKKYGVWTKVWSTDQIMGCGQKCGVWTKV